MLGNLTLPTSPKSRTQVAQDPHFQVQHQAPINTHLMDLFLGCTQTERKTCTHVGLFLLKSFIK